MSEHQQRTKRSAGIVFGIHNVEELLASGKTIEKIFLLKQKQDGISAILHEAQQRDIPVQFVPEEKLFRLAGKNHQGIAALASPVNYFRVDDVIAQVYAEGKLPLLLIADGITDVRNIGAIARTCWGAGASALVIPQTGTASLNDEALKSSAGALNHLPVCREKNLLAAVKQLKLNGVQVIATNAKAEKFIHEVDLTMPSAIVMGDEGTGVSNELLRAADVIAKLPLVNQFDSYNVSVAAGMILYEAMKQRM